MCILRDILVLKVNQLFLAVRILNMISKCTSGVNSNFPGCLITQGILYPDVYKYYTEKYKTWKIK